MNGFHKCVLLEEALEGLNVRSGEKYIDASLGGGGHTREILKRGGVVLGIDQDLESVEFVKRSGQVANLKIVQGNFNKLEEMAKKEGFESVSGILFDLGMSSHQLESDRGFSFQRDDPLDMRMDSSLAVTAKDLVNALHEGELYELFTKYGEESFARPIARAIVASRLKEKIETTGNLADLIERVVKRRGSASWRIHPATRVFQALRIAVNDELNSLKQALPQALGLLKNDGRLVVISFHSLEDRIVKEFFKKHADKELRILTPKPLIARTEEIKVNPRARSAKLRTAEKI